MGHDCYTVTYTPPVMRKCCTGIEAASIYKYTHDYLQPYPIRTWSADLSRLWPSFRALSSPGRSPCTPQPPGVGGSARSARWRPREALTLRFTMESPKIPALSVFWATVSRQCVCIRVVLLGASSPTFDAWRRSPTVAIAGDCARGCIWSIDGTPR